MNKTQNNPKGILFILIGMGFFSIQDALIKFVYNDAALYELYFGRTVAALFFNTDKGTKGKDVVRGNPQGCVRYLRATAGRTDREGERG